MMLNVQDFGNTNIFQVITSIWQSIKDTHDHIQDFFSSLSDYFTTVNDAGTALSSSFQSFLAYDSNAISQTIFWQTFFSLIIGGLVFIVVDFIRDLL